MEMIARVNLRRVSPEGDDVAGRIAWLTGFCGLMPLDVEVLSLLAAAPPPDPDGWAIARLAMRLKVSERTLHASLDARAALRRGGLVRISPGPEPRVALSDRIARFLFAPPRRS